VAAAAAVAAVLVGNVGEMENTMKLSVRRTLMSVGLVIAAIGLSGCSYNRFVTQEESIKAQWAQVENQLQRRNDLIPNLVETVKGFAQQERDVFGQIADSRAKLAGARTPEQTIQAANEQSAALARLLVITENYPQLRSNESFNRLMDELSGTENRIAVERMRYNERVQEYNTSRRQFPANLTANVFGFKEYPLFNAPPEAERVPRVNFGRQSS
jgi:LemA protein